ncbi:VOC family protein [Hyphococcus luteus]|nr:VOC family protein [Marinicaulis flavus]
MLYHAAICIRDVERSARFYDSVLGVIGMRRVWDLTPDAVGYGIGRAEFWIQTPAHQKSGNYSQHCHYAFACPDRDTLKRLFEAAMEAGAKSEAEPALVPEIRADYFGAMFQDLDGNKVEILVYREPEHSEDFSNRRKDDL